MPGKRLFQGCFLNEYLALRQDGNFLLCAAVATGTRFDVPSLVCGRSVPLCFNRWFKVAAIALHSRFCLGIPLRQVVFVLL